MTDAGVSCTKKSHGRGAGTPIHACADNMDKGGALCYPKCKAGFHGVGPVCWESCPSGLTDAGVSCTKKSHGRGAGAPIHACADNMDKDGALCYPKCKAGFHGVGPVCWESKT